HAGGPNAGARGADAGRAARVSGAACRVGEARTALHGRDECARRPRAERRRARRRACARLRLTAKYRSSRAGEEAGLDEERHGNRLRDGLAVEALYREALCAAALDVSDEL